MVDEKEGNKPDAAEEPKATETASKDAETETKPSEEAKADAPAEKEADVDADEAKAKAKAEPEDDPGKSPTGEKAVAEEKVAPEVGDAKPKAAPKESAPVVHPLLRFDLAWTRLEARIVTVVLFAEIAALCVWVSLKGMSADYKPGLLDADSNPVPVDMSGLVYRCIIFAVVFGLIAYRVTRTQKDDTRSLAVFGGIGVGIALGRVFASAGSEYFSNLLNWMQTASMLTLFGGLRGLATRLTLWLALLGGSLATGQGKHINVDVAMRFLSPKLRVPVAVIGWVAAAAVCASGAYGFFDHIAIEGFKVRAVIPCAADAAKDCDKPFSDKFAEAKKGIGTDLFLFRKQASLDLKSVTVVLGGHNYNEYLKPKEWNEWLRGGGWTDHFAKEDVDGQLMDESNPELTRLPVINVPGTGENTQGLLIRDLDFVFPFGLLMIALRFLLRCVLAILGLVKVDPDAVHGDADIEKHHQPEEPKEVA